MNFTRIVAVATVLLFVAGCGGESTSEKMARMAQERAKIRAADRDQKEDLKQQHEKLAKKEPDARPESADQATTKAESSPEEPLTSDEKPNPQTEVVNNEQTEASNPDAAPPEPPAKPPRSKARSEDNQPAPAAQVAAFVPSADEATIPDHLLAFIPATQSVAYVGENETIGIFDVEDGRLTRQIYNPQLKPVSLAIGSQGRLLLAGGEQGHLKIFSLDSLNSFDKFQQTRVLRRDAMPPRKAHATAVTGVAVDDAIGLAASGDTQGILKLWRASDMNPLEFDSGSEVVSHLRTLTDGKAVVGASHNRVFHWVYDRGDPEPGGFDGITVEKQITSIAAAPDGQSLAVGDASGHITTWTLRGEQALRQSSLKAYTSPVTNLAFGGDGKSLTTVSQTGELTVWEYPLQDITRFATVEPPRLTVASADAALIGLSSQQRNLDLYSTNQGKAVRRHTVVSGELTAAEFSSDSKLIALGNHEGKVFFEDDAKRTVAYTQCDSSPVIQLARAPRGADQDSSPHYAFITKDGTFGIASFPGAAEIPLPVQVDVASISPDGATLLVAHGGQLHAISRRSSEITASASIDDSTITAIGTQNDRVALGTQDGALWTWNFGAANATPEILRAGLHASQVQAIAWRDTGDIVSSDDRGMVRITSPQPIAQDKNEPEPSAQTRLRFSQQPSAVIAGSGAIFAAVGPAVESHSGAGDSKERVVLSSTTLRCLAYHWSSKRIAACDQTGQLFIQHDEQPDPDSIGLPVKNVDSLIWSDNGKHVAASDGNRLVIVSTESARIESQCVLSVPAASLLGWIDDHLWFVDNQSQLRRMQLPLIRWRVALGEEGSSAAWSHDGTSVAALTRAGTVVRFDPKNGDETARVAAGKSEARCLVAIPGNGEFAFLASNVDAMLLGEDGTLTKLPIASPIGLRQLRSSSDGRLLYTVDTLGRILAWDRTATPPTASAVPCDISCEHFLPLDADRLLATSGVTKEAMIIPTSLKGQRSLRLGGPISAMVLSRDASLAGFADGGDTVTLVSLHDSERRELKAAGLTFQRIAINGDGSNVAAVAMNEESQNLLVILDVGSGEELSRGELSGIPKRIEYSRDGHQLAVELGDGRCEIYSAESATMLEATPALPGLETFTFAGDNTGLILANQQGGVVLQPLLALGEATTDQNALVGLAFIDAETPKLICCSRNGKISLWDCRDLSAPLSTLDGISGPLVACRVSPDKRYLCVLYEDAENTICIWDLNNLAPSEEGIQPSSVFKNSTVIRGSARNQSAAFTNDSEFVLVGTSDGNVTSWSMGESRMVASFARHRGPVLDIQTTQEPGVFLTGGEDQRILSGQLPSAIPPENQQVPREALVEIMSVYDLEAPQVVAESREDPFDSAREALVSGANMNEVLDRIEGDRTSIDEAKAILARIEILQSSPNWNARELSKLRRQLAESQRRLAPDANARSLASFAAGFSNLAFVADTNFKFGRDNEFRPVKLLFSDRFLYAARTSSNRPKKRWRPGDPLPDQGDNGALLSWDYLYSRLQAHAWSIEDLTVRELFPLPSSAGVFTVPQMLLFSQDGSSRELPKAASWAYSSLPDSSRQYLAVGTEGAMRSESDILKIFAIADLSKERVAPVSQYRGFEGVVTAMAFANNSPNIAFCVRGRAVHRLFIADAETLTLRKLEEVDHEHPWVTYDEESRLMLRTDAAAGITSLAFSPDDKVLVGHGHYEGDLYKFSQWNLQWDQSQRLANARKSSKEIENEGSPLIEESGSQSIWFVENDNPRENSESSDPSIPRLSSSSKHRALVRVKDGFMAVNLNANREELKIDYLTTHHKVPLFSVSDDGRWLIMGDDSGHAYIWNTIEGDRYSVTMDPATEATLRDPDRRLERIPERPAHTGPIAGVALSKPDPGRDYPAFAATFGEENKVKVWELFPILDPRDGLRSRNVAKYPVSRDAKLSIGH